MERVLKKCLTPPTLLEMAMFQQLVQSLKNAPAILIPQVSRSSQRGVGMIVLNASCVRHYWRRLLAAGCISTLSRAVRIFQTPTFSIRRMARRNKIQSLLTWVGLRPMIAEFFATGSFVLVTRR
jgi:hypothetical protein